jgi:hypothetical protein
MSHEEEKILFLTKKIKADFFPHSRDFQFAVSGLGG